VHSVLRLINTPMRIWTRYQMMSYQLMLRKVNPNKTENVDDDVTAVVPLAERTRLLELNVPRLHTDHETCDETSTKQPTTLFCSPLINLAKAAILMQGLPNTPPNPQNSVPDQRRPASNWKTKPGSICSLQQSDSCSTERQPGSKSRQSPVWPAPA